MAGSRVCLVPGFFGFTSSGALNYFYRVREKLGSALGRQGVAARIVESAIQPTGSLRNRARWLLRQVIESGGLEAERLHFIGHSTGGLDARLLLTPDVHLGDERGAEEAVAVALARAEHDVRLPRMARTA